MFRSIRILGLSVLLVVAGCVAVSKYEWAAVFQKEITTKIFFLLDNNMIIVTADVYNNLRVQELNDQGDVVNDREIRIVGAYVDRFINGDQYLATMTVASKVALVDLEEGILWQTTSVEAPYYSKSTKIKTFSDSLISVFGQYTDTDDWSSSESLGGFVSIMDMNGDSLWSTIYPDAKVVDVHWRDDSWVIALKQEDETFIVKQYDEVFGFIGEVSLNQKGWLQIYDQGFIIKDNPYSYVLDLDGNELLTLGFDLGVSSDESLFVFDDSNLTRYDWDGRVLWSKSVSIPDNTRFGLNFSVSESGTPTLAYTTVTVGGYSMLGALTRYQTQVQVFNKDTGKKTLIVEQPAESAGICFGDTICDDRANKQGNLMNVSVWAFGDRIYTLNEYGYPTIFLINESQVLNSYKLN